MNNYVTDTFDLNGKTPVKDFSGLIEMVEFLDIIDLDYFIYSKPITISESR